MELATEVFDALPLAVAVVDEALAVRAANDAFLRLFRRSPAEVLFQHFTAALPGRWSHGLVDRVVESIHSGQGSVEAAYDSTIAAPVACTLHIRRLAGVAGRSSRTLILFVDVTARRLADSATADEHRELARSNASLAEFAHAASHDLQEPLRKIMTYADRLERRHSAVLPEDAKHDLERIRAAGLRMRSLTEALLEAAKASASPPQRVPTELAVVVREVLDDLALPIQERGAQITVGDLPCIEADPFQMRQLVQNLVSNALKFQRPGVAPAIVIRSESSADREVVSVSDNGIGFEAQYAERVFGMFMRLHSRADYQGNGVGLALCRTIAHRHRGSISATSEPGRGSTFTVTLPRHAPTSDTPAQ